MLFAFNDGHLRAGLLRGKRGRHTGGAASDNDHVEGLRLHRSVAPASARSSRISSVAILAHPLQRSLNQPRSGIL